MAASKGRWLDNHWLKFKTNMFSTFHNKPKKCVWWDFRTSTNFVVTISVQTWISTLTYVQLRYFRRNFSMNGPIQMSNQRSHKKHQADKSNAKMMTFPGGRGLAYVGSGMHISLKWFLLWKNKQLPDDKAPDVRERYPRHFIWQTQQQSWWWCRRGSVIVMWLWFIMLRKSSSKEVCDLLRFLRGAATLHKRIFVQNTEKRACAHALIKS